MASLVFDLAAVLGDESEVFAQGAYWLIGIGIVGALAAAVLGLMDLSMIPAERRPITTGLLHIGHNLTVVALYAVNLAVRSRRAKTRSAASRSPCRSLPWQSSAPLAGSAANSPTTTACA